jgi:hypothetical protein
VKPGTSGRRPGPNQPESEADFQAAVIDTARLLGYRVAHFAPARTKHGWRTPARADGKGFPDCVLVGRGRTLFVELKTDSGKLSDDQKAWMAALGANGAEAYVFRPSMWDEIAEVLAYGQLHSNRSDRQAS